MRAASAGAGGAGRSGECVWPDGDDDVCRVLSGAWGGGRERSADRKADWEHEDIHRGRGDGSGKGVARGYLNQAGMTAERFVPDGFSSEVGERIYRTGDLGRWRNDGNVEFLGRNDFQVKVRGFRIELGEIEAPLREHAGIQEAVVVVREDEPGEKRLVAYYTGKEGSEGDEVKSEQLRGYLSGKLPEYMVPAAYVRLEAMPLTANGKLDRKALPAPEADAYGASRYEAPEGEIETAVAGIWAEVLKQERIGRQDNFFALGGHSLLAVSVVERMRRQGLGVDIRALFATPTVSDLAAS